MIKTAWQRVEHALTSSTNDNYLLSTYNVIAQQVMFVNGMFGPVNFESDATTQEHCQTYWQWLDI